MIQFNP